MHALWRSKTMLSRGRGRHFASAIPPRFVLSVALLLVAVAGESRGDSAFFRSFDGPQIHWQLADTHAGVQILAHGCVGDDARQGTGSERLVINAPVGESFHFVCPVGRVPVLDELEIAMWIKANQPGVALAARVVLPRTIDNKTGKPRTVVVTGPQTGDVNRWQQMLVTGLPKLLAEQVRVLRATPGANIDPREAYVDAVVLVVPGGIESTAVWTDALSVEGIVVTAANEEPMAASSAALHGWRHERSPGANATADRPPPPIERRGNMLTVAGRPFYSRGIRWRDEPLDFLAARGFNTVWTDQLPTADEMAKAERANLWFVCPPPRADAVTQDGLSMPLDRVLAWNLGRPEGRHDLEYFRRWAETVREQDPLAGRPVIVSPAADWWPCSRIGDVLLAQHAASSSLAAVRYSEWLRGLPLLAQPETPFWAALPTQPGDAVRRQATALSQRPQSSAMLDETQLIRLVHTAATTGCRGILFESDAALDTNDEPTAYRTLLLESLNRELQLIEPWLTNGKIVGQATVVDSSATALVLQVERARLVIPTSWNAPAGTSNPTAIIVPGVPESNAAYALSPAGLRPLESKRVAGGVRVTLGGHTDSLVLLTEDPAVITGLLQRFARDGRRAVQLERDLTVSRAKTLVGTARRLEPFGASSNEAMQAVGMANAELSRGGGLVAAGKIDDAYDCAKAARRLIANAAERQSALVTAQPLFGVPFTAAYGTLAEQLELRRALVPLRGGDNLLEGGAFEDLSDLKTLGWRHVNDPLAGVESRVELSPRGPHAGRYSLELSAKPAAEGESPKIVARPLVWITSPPVRAAADQMIEITGWIRIDAPITGSIDGLSIIDSLGGPELAIRTHATSGWQPFRILRGVPDTSDVTVTFALTGIGAASLDDVAIRTLASPSAKRLPPTESTPMDAAPAPAVPATIPMPLEPPSNAAQLQGPLFPAPVSR